MTYEITATDFNGLLISLFILAIGMLVLYLQKKDSHIIGKVLGLLFTLIGSLSVIWSIYSSVETYYKYKGNELKYVEVISGKILTIEYVNNDEVFTFNSGTTFKHRYVRSNRCLVGKLTQFEGVEVGAKIEVTFENPPQKFINCVLRVKVIEYIGSEQY